MKKAIAIIIGLVIILIAVIFICFGNEFTFNNQTLLKSPKVDIPQSTVNASVASYIDDQKLKNTTSSNSNISSNLNLQDSNYNSTVNKNTNTQKTNTQNVVSQNGSISTASALTNLMESGGVLYGYVADGAYIIIPCSQGKIINGQLSVPEYYLGMPWEEFNDYISIQNGSYVIKEYYKGKQTGVFDLKANSKGLSGSFTHIANNQTYNARFTSENDLKPGSLTEKPFYIGVIGNTAVTLTNEFNGSYVEYYHGDKHLFTVKKQANSQNANYNIQLNEYLGNVLTGEYLLNSVGHDTYTGIFIDKPNSANPIKSTVGLTGSFSPFSV